MILTHPYHRRMILRVRREVRDCGCSALQIPLIDEAYLLSYPVACALQACLNKHTYSPERCEENLRQLYLCCQKMYRENKGVESTACPMEKVVERWLKRNAESGKGA